jgi:hypothetical protein
MGWVMVLSAGLILGLGSNTMAAVTTISDGFTDDGSGFRDDGDTLSNVPVAVGGVNWDAEPDVIFSQPSGVATNELELNTSPGNGIGAFVPLGSNPIGSTFSVKVDVKYRQNPGDSPVNFHEVGFISDTALWNSMGQEGSLHVQVYSDNTIDVLYDPDDGPSELLADETHPSFNAFTLNLDGFNTVEIIYNEASNTVQVFVAGTNLFVPRLMLGQYLPDVDKAGFRCDFLRADASNVPARSVEYDLFEATVDDGTAITVFDGPVTYGGHTYYLLTPSALATAQLAAESMGGNLITINDQAENDWLYAQWGTFDTSSLGIPACGTAGENCLMCDIGTTGEMDAMWVGYHQPEPVDPGDEPAGNWQWISGSYETYTNWAGGHPANSNACPTGGSEANAAVLPHPEFGAAGGWFSWTTYPSVALHGVVEIGWIKDDLYMSLASGGSAGALFRLDRDSGDTTWLQPAGENWASLTFSGTAIDEARLFVAKPNEAGDVLIDELDPECTTYDLGPVCPSLNSVLLSTLIGGSPGTNPIVGTIRYSSYHNSLFLGINPDGDAVGTSNFAKAYEINLALDTLLNTYTGPTVSKAYSGETWGAGYSGVMVDISTKDGTLFMSAINLGEATDTHQGDLISFDTSGGSTSIFTTLVDGATANYTVLPAPGWDYPVAPVYRGIIPDGRETIYVAQSGGTGFYQQIELYLDEVDGDGNLAERVHPATPVDLTFSMSRRPHRAQFETATGIILAPAFNSGTSRSAGVNLFNPDDTRGKFNAGDNWTQWSGWYDVDSPGGKPPCLVSVWPWLDEVIVITPGQVGTVQTEYVVVNTGTDAIGYTVAESPDVGWLTLDKSGGGPIPTDSSDTVTATVDPSGMDPGVYTVDLVFTDDCVSSDENIRTRTVQMEVLECLWDVAPAGAIHVWADCANPQVYNYTVTNVAGEDISYTVEECDANGGAADWSWITLPVPASGGPISAGSNDTVPITVSASQSDTQGYIKFIPSCGTSSIGVTEQIREIRHWYAAKAHANNYLSGGFKHAYLGDVDPLLMDSCKHVPPDGEVAGRCLFVTLSGQSGFTGKIHGTVVDDPDAQNGKAFYISTAETGRAGYGTHVNDGITQFDAFKAHLGTTLVGRLKVTAYSIVGAMLWTYNDSISENPWMQSTHRTGWGGVANGKITEYHVKPTGSNIVTDSLASGADRSAYHIFRMAIGGGTYGDLVSFMVYFDEDPNPVIEVHGWWLSPAIYNYLGDKFCFGTYGGSASGDIYWDWISFTNRGMYAPGEEDSCIGTLIPEFPPPCNTPFADADNDGDVDQDDFATFQICYSGTAAHPDTPEYCRCFNREGADNDVDDSDFGEFNKCASGPNIPVAGDPDCNFNP